MTTIPYSTILAPDSLLRYSESIDGGLTGSGFALSVVSFDLTSNVIVFSAFYGTHTVSVTLCIGSSFFPENSSFVFLLTGFDSNKIDFVVTYDESRLLSFELQQNTYVTNILDNPPVQTPILYDYEFCVPVDASNNFLSLTGVGHDSNLAFGFSFDGTAFTFFNSDDNSIIYRCDYVAAGVIFVTSDYYIQLQYDPAHGDTLCLVIISFFVPYVPYFVNFETSGDLFDCQSSDSLLAYFNNLNLSGGVPSSASVSVDFGPLYSLLNQQHEENRSWSTESALALSHVRNDVAIFEAHMGEKFTGLNSDLSSQINAIDLQIPNDLPQKISDIINQLPANVTPLDITNLDGNMCKYKTGDLVSFSTYGVFTVVKAELCIVNEDVITPLYTILKDGRYSQAPQVLLTKYVAPSVP
jgi:hypothetical protein